MENSIIVTLHRIEPVIQDDNWLLEYRAFRVIIETNVVIIHSFRNINDDNNNANNRKLSNIVEILGHEVVSVGN